MSEREIILVDSDSKVRSEMADSFRKAGYRVEATDSLVHVFCTVLERQMPVVLLGSGNDRKVALADLVPLLKKCNRGVSIILVSDEESLPAFQAIRQEGIFYHALKPTGREDTEEILAAVECAFNKTERIEREQAHHFAAKQEASPAAAMAYAAPLVMEPAAEELPEPAITVAAREPMRQKMSGKATATLTALIAAAAGFAYCVFAAIRGMKENGDLLVWGFLGFCALIIVGQLLPAFFSFMSAKTVAEQRLQEELAVRIEAERAQATLDNNE